MITKKEHILPLIKKKVAEIDSTAEVILFGSRARGDASEDSDWDVLILTDYTVSFQIEQRFRHHLFSLELALEEAISTFVTSKADWYTRLAVTPFYQNVNREGVRL